MSVIQAKRVREDGNLITSQLFAKLFQSYSQCSDAVQAAIREMIEIVNSDEATDDEQQAALSTISEALFPSHQQGAWGVDLEELETESLEDAQEAMNDLDQEEASFAHQVAAFMAQRGMTQEDLAAKIGIGQSAVSMMLSRKCRPQARTVVRIAQALEVDPQEIWPPFFRSSADV